MLILTFARELFQGCRYSPLLLLEAFTASRALRPASVVLASAKQFLRQSRVQHVASIRVSVAHAPATDTDIFDRVKIL